MLAHKSKRFLSTLLALVMVLGLLPFSAMAEELGVLTAPVEGQDGYYSDGYYYVWSWVVDETESTPDTSTPAQEAPATDGTEADAADTTAEDPSAEADVPAEESSPVDPVTPVEPSAPSGHWDYARYPFYTVTFVDPTGANETVSKYVVPALTGETAGDEFGAPLFTAPQGEEYDGALESPLWVTEDGSDAALTDLSGDATLYADWGVSANTDADSEIKDAEETEEPAMLLGESGELVDYTFNVRVYNGNTLLDTVPVTISVPLNKEFSPSIFRVDPITYQNWDFLYNGSAEVKQSPGIWCTPSALYLAKNSKGNLELHAKYHYLLSDRDKVVDEKNFCLYTDWPYTFYDMGSSEGVEIAYSLGGGPLQTLDLNSRLYLFNNTEALNNVSAVNPGLDTVKFSVDSGIMFFVKSKPGYVPLNGEFSSTTGNQRQEISPLTENLGKKLEATYGASKAEAMKSGYTYEFHYTLFESDWDGGYGTSGFQFAPQEDTNLYTITYDANAPEDDTVHGSTPASDPALFGTQVLTAQSGFYCDNHTFTGWNTAPDGSGTSYEAGLDSYTIEGHDVTLYAQWGQGPAYNYHAAFSYTYGNDNASVPTAALSEALGDLTADGVKASVAEGKLVLSFTKAALDALTKDVNGTAYTVDLSRYVPAQLQVAGATYLCATDTAAALVTLDLGQSVGPVVFHYNTAPQITVEHWLGTNNGHSHMGDWDQSVAYTSGTLSEEYVLSLAARYQKTMAEATKGGNNFLYKSAEALPGANGDWTLKLNYNQVSFYVNTSGIPARKPGATYAGPIAGILTGITLDTVKHADADKAPAQYTGKFDEINLDLAKAEVQQYIVSYDTAALAKLLGNSFDPNTQEVLWYSIHEGNFVHVDGVLVDKEASVTYHSNLPANAGTDMSYIDPAINTPSNNYDVLAYDDLVTANAMPAIPENYRFCGWSTKENARPGDSGVYSGDSEVIIAQSVDFYAVWEKLVTVTGTIDHGGRVSIQYDNITFTTDNRCSALIPVGRDCVVTGIPAEGYHITSGNSPATFKNLTTDQTVHFTTAPNTHKVTVNYQFPDGYIPGEAYQPKTLSVAYGASYNVDTADYKLAAPAGYYYASASGALQGTMPNHDITITFTYAEAGASLIIINYLDDSGIQLANPNAITTYSAGDAYDVTAYAVEHLGDHSQYTLDTTRTEGDLKGTLGTPDQDVALTINLYYTLNSYPYTVTYRNDTTGETIAQVNGAGQTALYGATLTQELVAQGMNDANWITAQMPGGYHLGSVTYPTIGIDSNDVVVHYLRDSSSGGGGGNRPKPTPDPVVPNVPDEPTTPDVPVIDIPDEDVPLVDTPDVTVPDMDIPDGDIPLGDLPEGETGGDSQVTTETDGDGTIIVGDHVPTGNLPQTGTTATSVDPTATLGLTALAMSMMAAGLAFILTRKKEDAEN